VEHPGAGLAALRQLGGKELSFNNLLDLDGALMAIEPFIGETCCAIIKHTTPSGLATGATAVEAYQKALATDPVSAFGSVIAFTTTVDDETANAVASLFVECLVAPAFSEGAIEALGRKRNLRILAGRAAWSAKGFDIKRVRGGILVQDRVAPPGVGDDWKVVTRRQPTAEERRDLEFAWRAVASVKSNAIVIAKGGATIGIGGSTRRFSPCIRLAPLGSRSLAPCWPRTPTFRFVTAWTTPPRQGFGRSSSLGGRCGTTRSSLPQTSTGSP
jgi:phosphoribosylaminoimidazolecarboxamide formyltransferase/IMP cyclohydrolase